MGSEELQVWADRVLNPERAVHIGTLPVQEVASAPAASAENPARKLMQRAFEPFDNPEITY